MTKPVNILYVITDLNIGGTEKMLFETVTRLNRNIYRPIVFSLKKWGNCAEKLKNAGIEVRALNIYRLGKLFLPFFIIFAITSITKTVKKRDVSIICTYLFQANIIARIAFLLTKKPVIISSIRVMEEQKKWQLFFDRLTSKLCALVIVNSIALKRFLVKNRVYPDNMINVVYNGIDSSKLQTADKSLFCKELNLNPESVLIGAIGRLHEQKGFKYLIDAINKINLQTINNNMQFVIIGDGPERNKLESIIDKYNLKDKVKITGWRTDASEIISILDIFVIPSLWEGTPNVILEAMAYGKPVISTNVGGVPELIENMKEGILIAPADSNELVEKIIWMTQNKNKAAEFGINAKEKIKKSFSIEKMIAETELIYQNLLKAGNNEPEKT